MEMNDKFTKLFLKNKKFLNFISYFQIYHIQLIMVRINEN